MKMAPTSRRCAYRTKEAFAMVGRRAKARVQVARTLSRISVPGVSARPALARPSLAVLPFLSLYACWSLTPVLCLCSFLSIVSGEHATPWGARRSTADVRRPDSPAFRGSSRTPSTPGRAVQLRARSCRRRKWPTARWCRSLRRLQGEPFDKTVLEPGSDWGGFPAAFEIQTTTRVRKATGA